MWTKIKPLLFLLSMGLNLAFVGVWAVHQFSAGSDVARGTSGHPSEACEECPLHEMLGTTESQRRAIESLQAKFRDSSQTLCGHLCRHRSELIDLIASDPMDPTAIRAKQDIIFANQRRVEDLIVEQLLAEKSLLSPAQREKLFGMIRNRCNCIGHGTGPETSVHHFR